MPVCGFGRWWWWWCHLYGALHNFSRTVGVPRAQFRRFTSLEMASNEQPDLASLPAEVLQIIGSFVKVAPAESNSAWYNFQLTCKAMLAAAPWDGTAELNIDDPWSVGTEQTGGGAHVVFAPGQAVDRVRLNPRQAAAGKQATPPLCARRHRAAAAGAEPLPAAQAGSEGAG